MKVLQGFNNAALLDMLGERDLLNTRFRKDFPARATLGAGLIETETPRSKTCLRR
jgi:hypothetical protein